MKLPSGEWAITKALAGIHCAGLLNEDFKIFGDRDASMVWSPMSNLLLYGATSRVKSARDNGVRIGLGSDWAVSGQQEPARRVQGRAARERRNEHGLHRSRSGRDGDEAMRPPSSAGSNVLGSLRPGARADLIVLDGTPADPYKALVAAKETALSLVMINGVARFGTTALMTKLGDEGERVTIGGRQRMLFLEQQFADEVVAGIELGQAKRNARRRAPTAAGSRERFRE